MPADLGHLVQEASAGDAVAADRLLERFLPELRAFLRLRAGPRILAQESTEDLVQSVCREILQDLSAWEYRGEAAFKNWLYVNALRKIVDRDKFYRREKRAADREQALPDDPQVLSGYASLVTPSQVAIQREDVARLEDAFDRLPPDYREIITQAKVIGLSHAEIAGELGKSVEATRALLHRALVRLGRLMAESP